MDLSGIGRVLLLVAVVIFIAGLLMIGLGKLGLGRLPGDITYRRDGVTIYFPLATSIILSILLSLILSFILWFFSRGRG
ncbi:MAG: DUF2905 family protein [Armatimonadota bacterium]